MYTVYKQSIISAFKTLVHCLLDAYIWMCVSELAFITHPLSPWPNPSSDIHRTASCTCWSATSASRPDLSASKTVRTSLIWSSLVRRECTTRCWRVRQTDTLTDLGAKIQLYSTNVIYIFSWFYFLCSLKDSLMGKDKQFGCKEAEHI